jgi:hypothetical protein
VDDGGMSIMNIKVDSLSVLRVIYSAFETKKTLKTNLSYNEIHKELPEISIDDVKVSVEYLAGHGYVTYTTHPIFHDVCITSRGIDFYLENFQ